MDFQIDANTIIKAVSETRTLLASVASAGKGSVKLHMTLKFVGSALKPEYTVSGEVEGAVFNIEFNEETAELHDPSPYPLENAVMSYNYYARKIS